jgi:hypothetical protein
MKGSEITTCGKCGTTLVYGPKVGRTADTGRFSVTINNLPTKVCQKGCSGFYWYHPELPEEIVAIVTRDSAKWAKSVSTVKVRQICRKCGKDLEEGGMTLFKFEKIPFINRGKITVIPNPFSKKGGEKPSAVGPEGKIVVMVSAPSLACSGCNTHYLPPISGDPADPYYKDLFAAIRKAITQDFIFDESAFNYWRE